MRECHILPDWLLIYFVYSVNLNATAQEIRNALFQFISNQSQTAFP
nr:type II toxin-antitoxin system YafQ family toxin [Candidatus Desulfovibrio trichonymphae]